MTTSACGKRLHWGCRCIRPAGHDGPCACLFTNALTRLPIHTGWKEAA